MKVGSYSLIVFILALVGWAYFTVAFTYWGPVLAAGGSVGDVLLSLLVLLLLTFIVVVQLISYFRCVFTSPGIVPDTFGQGLDAYEGLVEDGSQENDLASQCIQRKRDGSLRYCTKCRVFKPDRTHHCEVLNKCVLKMDHFCPWMANTIGFFNYKYFVLFLFYSWVYTIFCPIAYSYPAILILTGSQSIAAPASNVTLPEMDFGLKMSSIICCGVALLFFLMLCYFGGFHFFLVFNNKTTIEQMEKRKGSAMFNLGKRKNFESVMGTKRLFWFLPTYRTVEGNGLTYVMRETLNRQTANGM